jgi:hypothetical protein
VSGKSEEGPSTGDLSTKPPQTIAELNVRAQKFWENQNGLTAERLSRPALVEVALATLESERLRQIPIGYWSSFDKALELAEKSEELFKVEFSRKGGAAPKTDALQQFIIRCIRSRSALTESQLLASLRENRRVFDVREEEVCFDKPDGSRKSVPISALKDRLYRARRNNNNSR